MGVADFGVDKRQNGQRECCGFAGAGLGQAEHIMPIEEHGYGLGLDGGRGFKPHIFYCFDYRLGKAQRIKAGTWGFF